MADHAAQYGAKLETRLRVASAILFMGGLGTLYIFSVFVSYLEPQYGDRAAISGIFSATVFSFGAASTPILIAAIAMLAVPTATVGLMDWEPSASAMDA